MGKTPSGGMGPRGKILGKIARQHPQSDYSGLGMSLQIEWQNLQRAVPRVGTLIDPIEESLRDKFFPALFRGEEMNANFRKILGHSVKHGGLCIPDPRLSAERAYNTSKADSGELVDSLLGGFSLNCISHRVCVHGASAEERRERRHVK